MRQNDATEDINWINEFMALYQQAKLIHEIARVSPDGLPPNLPILFEGTNTLPPILKSIKKLPKPRNGNLRSLKKDFERVLGACIKASEFGVKLSKDPKSRIRFAMLVGQTTTAAEFMKAFSQRLATISDQT